VKKARPSGFEYFVDDETLRSYGKKPLLLRLRWLYMGNLLRRSYPPEVLKLHQRFREGATEDLSS
jgi:hypothetical protein